jgi:hypothetical protein
MFREMTNPRDFGILRQEMNLGPHIMNNPLTITPNLTWKCRQERKQQLFQKSYGNVIIIGAKLLAFAILPRNKNSIRTISCP